MPEFKRGKRINTYANSRVRHDLVLVYQEKCTERRTALWSVQIEFTM